MQKKSPIFETLTGEIEHRSFVGLLAILVILLHLWVVVNLMDSSNTDKTKVPLKVMEVDLVIKPKPEPKPEPKPLPKPEPKVKAAPSAPAKTVAPKLVKSKQEPPKKTEVKPPVKKAPPVIPKVVEAPKLKLQKTGAEPIPVTAQPFTAKATQKPQPQQAITTPKPSVTSKPSVVGSPSSVGKPSAKPGNGSANSNGVSSGVVELGCPKPNYPARALSRNIQGRVKVEISISATGTVTDVNVIDAQPAGIFDSAALDSARKCKFKPKIVNGVAVPIKKVKPYVFNHKSE